MAEEEAVGIDPPRLVTLAPGWVLGPRPPGTKTDEAPAAADEAPAAAEEAAAGTEAVRVSVAGNALKGKEEERSAPEGPSADEGEPDVPLGSEAQPLSISVLSVSCAQFQTRLHTHDRRLVE